MAIPADDSMEYNASTPPDTQYISGYSKLPLLQSRPWRLEISRSRRSAIWMIAILTSIGVLSLIMILQLGLKSASSPQTIHWDCGNITGSAKEKDYFLCFAFLSYNPLHIYVQEAPQGFDKEDCHRDIYRGLWAHEALFQVYDKDYRLFGV